MFSDSEFVDQRNFTDSILVLANNYNFSVTSWGRSEHRNKMVGGVADSQHLKWLAVDVVPDDDVDREKMKADIKAQGLQLIIETDHWHIQLPR